MHTPQCFPRRRDQAATSKRLERTGPSRCRAAAPFNRLDLEGGAFTLTIGSDDWWKPDYFAVFGVDTVNGGPRALIPFVAASAFELRQMSSDPAEGFHSMVLPTAKVVPQLPIHPDVDAGDLDGVFVAVGVPHPQNPG